MTKHIAGPHIVGYYSRFIEMACVSKLKEIEDLWFNHAYYTFDGYLTGSSKWHEYYVLVEVLLSDPKNGLSVEDLKPRVIGAQVAPYKPSDVALEYTGEFRAV